MPDKKDLEDVSTSEVVYADAMAAVEAFWTEVLRSWVSDGQENTRQYQPDPLRRAPT